MFYLFEEWTTCFACSTTDLHRRIEGVKHYFFSALFGLTIIISDLAHLKLPYTEEKLQIIINKIQEIELIMMIMHHLQVRTRKCYFESLNATRSGHIDQFYVRAADKHQQVTTDRFATSQCAFVWLSDESHTREVKEEV